MNALATALEERFDEEEVYPLPLTELEFLRQVLSSFMKRDVLEALGTLNVELNKEPVASKAFAYFTEKSELGPDCKYAQAYLKKFKEERLDLVIERMEICLKLLKEMKE